MANISSKTHHGVGHLFNQLAVVAALGACSLAHAGVLDFEGPSADTPFIFAGDINQFGDYWAESYGGTQPGDLVGSVIDGSDNGLCVGITCPANNASHYCAALDDGYFYFGLKDNLNFTVKSLQASFIGAGQPSFPATSGVLLLQGYDSAGVAVSSALQIGLSGPTAGAFNFASYDLSATTFGNTSFGFVLVLGFACDASGDCNRGANLANYALDNFVTVTVPEPGTWALLGLGLAGLGVFSRRRPA